MSSRIHFFMAENVAQACDIIPRDIAGWKNPAWREACEAALDFYLPTDPKPHIWSTPNIPAMVSTWHKGEMFGEIDRHAIVKLQRFACRVQKRDPWEYNSAFMVVSLYYRAQALGSRLFFVID